MSRDYNSLFIYLIITFGIAWIIMFAYVAFSDFLTPITGPLTVTNPVSIFVLYLPSIAGLITYQVRGGFRALKEVIKKLIPRKQDLLWFPLLFVVFALFALFIHYGSVFFKVPLPKMDLTISQMIIKVLVNLFTEVGILGGVFGWMGFLLPFLQGKLKNNITAGLLTGFIFALWIFPEFLLLEKTTSFFLYVIQLMSFILFLSYIFNATKGNLLFYLYAFWLAATGSRIQLYYWNTSTQVFEIVFFVLAVLIIHIIFKVKQIDYSLQVFPDFIQQNEINKDVDEFSQYDFDESSLK